MTAPSGNGQCGKIDLLSLVGIGFLITSLVAVISVTASPQTKQNIGSYAKVLIDGIYTPQQAIREANKTSTTNSINNNKKDDISIPVQAPATVPETAPAPAPAAPAQPDVGKFGYVYPNQMDNGLPYIAGTYVYNGERYLVQNADTFKAAKEFAAANPGVVEDTTSVKFNKDVLTSILPAVPVAAPPTTTLSSGNSIDICVQDGGTVVNGNCQYGSAPAPAQTIPKQTTVTDIEQNRVVNPPTVNTAPAAQPVQTTTRTTTQPVTRTTADGRPQTTLQTTVTTINADTGQVIGTPKVTEQTFSTVPTTSIAVNQQGNVSFKSPEGGNCQFASDCNGNLSCSPNHTCQKTQNLNSPQLLVKNITDFTTQNNLNYTNVPLNVLLGPSAEAQKALAAEELKKRLTGAGLTLAGGAGIALGGEAIALAAPILTSGYTAGGLTGAAYALTQTPAVQTLGNIVSAGTTGYLLYGAAQGPNSQAYQNAQTLAFTGYMADPVGFTQMFNKGLQVMNDTLTVAAGKNLVANVAANEVASNLPKLTPKNPNIIELVQNENGVWTLPNEMFPQQPILNEIAPLPQPQIPPAGLTVTPYNIGPQFLTSPATAFSGFRSSSQTAVNMGMLFAPQVQQTVTGFLNTQYNNAVANTANAIAGNPATFGKAVTPTAQDLTQVELQIPQSVKNFLSTDSNIIAQQEVATSLVPKSKALSLMNSQSDIAGLNNLGLPADLSSAEKANVEQLINSLSLKSPTAPVSQNNNAANNTANTVDETKPIVQKVVDDVKLQTDNFVTTYIKDERGWLPWLRTPTPPVSDVGAGIVPAAPASTSITLGGKSNVLTRGVQYIFQPLHNLGELPFVRQYLQFVKLTNVGVTSGLSPFQENTTDFGLLGAALGTTPYQYFMYFASTMLVQNPLEGSSLLSFTGFKPSYWMNDFPSHAGEPFVYFGTVWRMGMVPINVISEKLGFHALVDTSVNVSNTLGAGFTYFGIWSANELGLWGTGASPGNIPRYALGLFSGFASSFEQIKYIPVGRFSYINSYLNWKTNQLTKLGPISESDKSALAQMITGRLKDVRGLVQADVNMRQWLESYGFVDSSYTETDKQVLDTASTEALSILDKLPNEYVNTFLSKDPIQMQAVDQMLTDYRLRIGLISHSFPYNVMSNTDKELYNKLLQRVQPEAPALPIQPNFSQRIGNGIKNFIEKPQLPAAETTAKPTFWENLANNNLLGKLGVTGGLVLVGKTAVDKIPTAFDFVKTSLQTLLAPKTTPPVPFVPAQTVPNGQNPSQAVTPSVAVNPQNTTSNVSLKTNTNIGSSPINNFSVYMQRNGSSAPINKSGDTMLTRGCGPSTAYNILKLAGQNPNINNIVDNFYWNCQNGCATDASAVLLTLQKNGFTNAVSNGLSNRITDANQLKNYTGLLVYGGTASSPTESVAHIAGFDCKNGNCVSIDSYFSDGTPVQCNVSNSNTIKCGSYSYNVGLTGGSPDALYPVSP